MGGWLENRRDWLVAFILAVTVCGIYWRTYHFGFVMYDDPQYMNGTVQAGLTFDGVRWALTSSHAANWFPLTWLGYMLTVQLFGAEAGAFHLVNVLFHALNAALLLIVLKHATGTLWRSAFVAALFALHPLRVESVAWIAEFKDVLGGFFWFLTMLVYCRYARRPRAGRYLPVVLSFACGLMAKPMLVTLPLVLLFMDLWPLSRLRGGTAAEDPPRFPQVTLRRLLWEKVPLATLAGVSCIITLVVQKRGGALNDLDRESVAFNIANAVVSYVRYLGKAAWPVDLAVFYPVDTSLPFGRFALAFAVLAAVTILVLRQWQRRPYLVFGWLWYLVTLVPVIGFVRVGLQSSADRYTYIPLIGLAVVVSWGTAELTARLPRRRAALTSAAALVLSALSLGTWLQLAHWRNDFTLFEQALRSTERNWLAHNNLATALVSAGRLDEALWHVQKALRFKPDYVAAYNNLGVIHNRRGETQQSIGAYTKALSLDPSSSETRFNVGLIYVSNGQREEALGEYRLLEKIDPAQAATLLKFIRYADRMP